ncbi:MAG TPA: PAS domain S-box protein [Lutibacter sp.]
MKNVSVVDEKYFTFFENAPISLWIEDFSEIKKRIDVLVRESNTDIKTYISNNLDTLTKLASLRTLKDVNIAAVKLYNAKSKEELLENLPKVFIENSNAGFTKLLVDILLGKKEAEIESIHKTLDGHEINTLVKFKVIEGSEDTLEYVIVSVENITERVIKDQKFNTAKNFLSNTLTSIKEGLVILDRDSKYIYANQKAADLLGKNIEELIGKHIWTEFPEKAGEIFYDNYQKAISTGKPQSFENYFKSWGKWLENRIIPSQEGVLMFFHETTDKKETENQIKAAYNIINKSHTVAILCKNEWDFPIEFASENTINLFGYSYTELINGDVKLHQLVFPEDLKWVRETFFKLFKIEKSNEFKFQPFRIITKTGVVKWIQANIDVVKNSKKEVTHIQGICEDITDRKKAEEENRKHLLAIEKSANIIAITNARGVIEFINPKFTEIYGFTKEEILGKMYNILKSEKQPKGLYTQMWKTVVGGNIWQGQIQNKAKNGKLIWVQHTITPVKNDFGKIVNYITISEDITERKKAEDLFFESNQRLKDQFNNTPLASIIWDADFNVMEWNNSAQRIFGYSAEEARRLRIKDLITPPNLAPEMKKIQEDILAVKYAHRSTNKNMTKAGDIITCDWYNVTLKDATGKITGIASLADDITERIRSKKLLEKSEKKYRDLFEKSIDAILILKNGFIVDCNEAAINMYGFDRNEILGFRPSQLSPETQFDGASSIEKSEKMVNIALEQGSNRFRWYHQNKNGLVFPSEVTLTRVNENEDGLTIHAVITDITEKAKKETLENVLYNISKAALTTSDFTEFSLFVRNELQKIIDTSNFYIAIYNEETDMISTPVFVDDIEEVDEFSAKNSLTGYVIKSKKPLILTKDAHKELIKNKVVELIGGHAEIWVGVPLLIQETCIGAIVVQSYVDENAYNENDVQLLEFVADQISTTIQRKKVENELNSALAKAQESDRLKSAFLANMSHEIRTPMNGIIGFSELCLDQNITKEKQREYANIVIKSSKRLLSIVNDILDISKIEAGAVTLNIENVNLNKLLDELEVFYKPIAKKNNILLICERGLENFKSTIETDKTKLNQVLTNLLSNAFKFTDEGSVTFGYQLIENNLQFYVKDTGIGVDDDLHHKIFDRFSQGNLNLSKQHIGTGLGLAITKKIIELFQGEIWLNSDQPGTTIYFTIPYIKSKIPLISTVIDEQKPTNDVKNKEITILVAEDEEYNMMYINELFSSTNFKIIEANNGKKALELALHHPEIQLVLMDIKMPVMDGNEAMKEIKKVRPSLPVIALSAFAMESDKTNALALGFNAYLTKPLNRKLLFGLIEKYSKKRE